MDRIEASQVVVIVSANTEWQVVRELVPGVALQSSPLGQWFVTEPQTGPRHLPVVFLHGGWGKIAAAASAQYAIDRWRPALLVNLGTCGGFEGAIEPGTIVLAEQTVVYDIVEQMGDPEAAIAHYRTHIDLGWLGEACPQPVRRTLLVSGDRDLVAEEIPRLKAQFGAVAGDWESGAIAYVAARNGVRCLILRGVTDLVGSSGGEAYGNFQVFATRTAQVMACLLGHLPAWIDRAIQPLDGAP